MKYLISLIPVVLFLLLLIYMDSYKLVKGILLTVAILWGMVSACLSLGGNTLLSEAFFIDFQMLSLYIAPGIEEILKMALLIYLIAKKRIGTMIDAAIYGFAIGTGFALTENLVYLGQAFTASQGLWLWIARGFGTSLMHGGTTALAGIVIVGAANREKNMASGLILAVILAYILHGIYNHFFFNPLISSLLMVVLVPAAFCTIFNYQKRSVRKWLDMGFDSEAKLLIMIRDGRFSDTRPGKYLISVRNLFPKETVLDIYCYTELYLELSVKAKTLMMLKENDLMLPGDPEIQNKLTELKSLEKNIGKSAFLALSPILRMSRKELWAISLLK